MPTSNWTPNPAQRRAIEHGAGPLRIAAGAGSGKTTTLGHRIGSLVERGLCRADQILMLTFTTKAVADLRAKVGALLGPDSDLPRIETYHAFALALVREFADRLGLPPDPALLTEAPLKLLIRQQIDALGVERADLTQLGRVVDRVVEFAGWHRHEGAFRVSRAELLERLGDSAEREDWEELLEAYDAYRQVLRAKGAVDYDDLVALAVELLETCPDVRAELQARFPYLLVDEYQDTDFLQGEMVKLLAGDAGNITIVGDPDQTIYSFRGAAMSNIQQFHAAWPAGALAEVAMVTNYRSTPEIVAAANASIAHNQRRKAELLEAARPGGPRPVLAEAPDWPTEAHWLAQQVLALQQAGYALADMAVLVRKNKQKAGIHAALLEAGIPVQVVGGLDLFDEPEAVRCIGYIWAMAAPQDDRAVTVALGMPRYGLTDRDLAALARQRWKGETLLDVVSRVAAEDERLRLFVQEFWPLYGRQFTEGCQAAVRAAIALHAPGMGPETRAGLEQLLDLADSFFARPELYAGSEGAGGLALFVEYLQALRGMADGVVEAVQFDDDQDAVKLMTVHAAKGLEFPVVFLPRLTERDFAPKGGKWDRPFPLAWHHDAEFQANAEAMLAEEERRLFYVAVTRAMDQLFLSWAPVDPARKRPVKRSAFLDEIEACCDGRPVGLAEQETAATSGGVAPVVLPAGVVSNAPAAPLREVQPPVAPQPALPAVLSFSHLSTYQLCPFRFYLQYVLRLPGRPNRAADTGVRIHAAIERQAEQGGTFAEFVRWAAGAPVDAERAQLEPEQAEPAAEGPAGTAGDGPADTAGDGPVDPLRAYWESEYAATPPLASEQEFFLRVGDAVVRGFIDRIHPLPNGEVEVVDFKTYTRMQSEAHVKAGLQLPLYLLACREALGYPGARQGALFFLKHGQVVRVQYTDEELSAARHQAEELVRAILGRNFVPTPEQTVCGFCPYRESCAAAG